MASQVTRYFQLNRHDMAYLKFTIEAYDGLATLTTVDGRSGTVSITSPIGFAAETDALLRAITTEIPLTELPQPDNCRLQAESAMMEGR